MYSKFNKLSTISVPDNKSRNIPEVVLVRRWAVGVLGIWRGGGELGEGWGKWGQFTRTMRLSPFCGLLRDQEQFIYNWMPEDDLDLD